jgi:hypothetical protein
MFEGMHNTPMYEIRASFLAYNVINQHTAHKGKFDAAFLS